MLKRGWGWLGVKPTFFRNTVNWDLVTETVIGSSFLGRKNFFLKIKQILALNLRVPAFFN